MRGMDLSEDAVRHLLGAGGRARPGDARIRTDPGAGRPAGRLAGAPRLTELDAPILLIALAPDLDRTFEPLYGYLNDDVSRRRATVGLALDLCGLPAHPAAARSRFHPSAPLRPAACSRSRNPNGPS